MDLHASIPGNGPYPYLGLQKVRAGIGIVNAAAEHLDRFFIGGSQVGFIEILVLPDIMEKVFFHSR
jgi:hypothetical protein